MEGGLRRNDIIRELTRSPHGELKAYLPVGIKAAEQEPEFLAHLIAYNHKNGQIRDAKVALPLVSLSAWGRTGASKVFTENSLAHLALLDPRNLLRALKFGKEIGTQMVGMSLRRLVSRYLKAREANWAWWERTAVQHRASMHALYAQYHVKPSALADSILFGREYPNGTVFSDIKNLRNMGALEAAAMIDKHRLPFLVINGTIGDRLKKEDDLAIAMVERMTPTELVTNTKLLEKIGVRTRPALRAAYELGLGKAATSKKATFKTTRAAEAMGEGVLKEKLKGLQERQINALGGVEGDWLVLGDRSGSMERAIETSRRIASTLARVVAGKVSLVFFNTSPTFIDATGKTYDEILAKTANIGAGGGTSIGCGLQYALEKGININGIAIVSDAEENTAPIFADVYHRMVERDGLTPPVYLYLIKNSEAQRAAMKRQYGSGFLDADTLTGTMGARGYELQTFEIGADVDYYSLPNMIQTMRTSRYSLADQILETPLLTLDEVFRHKLVDVEVTA